LISNNKENNTLHIKVTPNASRNEIVGFTEGVLHLKIAAPPVRGKANRELTSFLSQALGVSKSSVSIVKGQTSRNKVVTIDGLTVANVIERLSP
jgi:uncharacterized protein (TIGR00251 family)